MEEAEWGRSRCDRIGRAGPSDMAGSCGANAMSRRPTAFVSATGRGFAKYLQPLESGAGASGFPSRDGRVAVPLRVVTVHRPHPLQQGFLCQPPPTAFRGKGLAVGPHQQAHLDRCTSRSPINQYAHSSFGVSKKPTHRLVKAYELLWSQRLLRRRGDFDDGTTECHYELILGGPTGIVDGMVFEMWLGAL